MLRVVSKTIITVFFALICVPIYVCWKIMGKLTWQDIKRIYKLWLIK